MDNLALSWGILGFGTVVDICLTVTARLERLACILCFLLGVCHMLPGNDLKGRVWHYWCTLFLSAEASSYASCVGPSVKPRSRN